MLDSVHRLARVVLMTAIVMCSLAARTHAYAEADASPVIAPVAGQGENPPPGTPQVGAAPPGSSTPETPAPETREISFRHMWSKETLSVAYKINGEYQPEAMRQINHVLRDYRCNKTTEMDARLIDLIWELAQEIRFTGPVTIVSAYRSEGYNASLLRAGRVVDPHSQHMFGRAIDVVFPGVPLTTLREAAARRKIGGVGHYPFSGPPFVHLDTGPVRRWEEMHPAERRALRLPMRGRRRLQLNCELKMADVLTSLTEAEAIAALPEGASTDLTPRLKPEGNGDETAPTSPEVIVPGVIAALPQASATAKRLASGAVTPDACSPGQRGGKKAPASCAKSPRRPAIAPVLDKTSEASLKRIIKAAVAAPRCRGAACSRSSSKPNARRLVATRAVVRRKARAETQKTAQKRNVVRKLVVKRVATKKKRGLQRSAARNFLLCVNCG